MNKLLLLTTLILFTQYSCKDTENTPPTAQPQEINKSNTEELTTGERLVSCNLLDIDTTIPFSWAQGYWSHGVPHGSIFYKTYNFDFEKTPATKTAFYYIRVKKNSVDQFCHIKIENIITNKEEFIDLASNTIQAKLELISEKPTILNFSTMDDQLKEECSRIAERFISLDEYGSPLPHPQSLILKCNDLAVDHTNKVYIRLP